MCIKIIHRIFEPVLAGSLEETIDDFCRDAHPEQELMVWERMAAAFLDAISSRASSRGERGEILSVLLSASAERPISEEQLRSLSHLTPGHHRALPERGAEDPLRSELYCAEAPVPFCLTGSIRLHFFKPPLQTPLQRSSNPSRAPKRL